MIGTGKFLLAHELIGGYISEFIDEFDVNRASEGRQNCCRNHSTLLFNVLMLIISRGENL